MVTKAVWLHGPFLCTGRLVTRADCVQKPFGYMGRLVAKAVCLHGPFLCTGRLVTRADCLQKPFGYQSRLVTRAVPFHEPFECKSRLVTRAARLHGPFPCESCFLHKSCLPTQALLLTKAVCLLRPFGYKTCLETATTTTTTAPAGASATAIATANIYTQCKQKTFVWGLVATGVICIYSIM